MTQISLEKFFIISVTCICVAGCFRTSSMKEVVNQSEPLFQDISITDLDISAKTQVVRSIGWRRINNKKVYLLTVFSTGKTLELAKQSAFTESVKIAVGSLIQSAAYVKEDELQAATQGGGRRRKTMKKSRKMRRKTNKKVRKMRRKSMKKSHKKK